MDLTSIILLLQLALSALVQSPHSPQTAAIVNQAIQVAHQAIAEQSTGLNCNNASQCAVSIPSNGEAAFDGGIEERERVEYPINPVSPCGTLACNVSSTTR